MFWEKKWDNTYMYESCKIFKISEDGKTLTSIYGNTYEGGDGITNGTWVMNSVEGETYRYEYVFNSDGTGTETYYNGDFVITFNLVWKDFEKNAFEYAYVYSIKFSEDGKTMYDIWGGACEESDGVWTNIRQDDWNYYYSYEFMDDGLCKAVCYFNDSEKVCTNLYYVWKDLESAGEREMIKVDLAYLELQNDGTLKNLDNSVVLKKV
ncbi:MAG: hypothetical protein Q4Q53_02265 [Methanocorpusculum sp.]|nr:hypothetical protein [Methanocorpusculum sp.]